MAKRKKNKDGSISFTLTVPKKLAAVLDSMLDNLRKERPFCFVSRSAFYAYCLGEWAALIADPHAKPKTPSGIRRRVRPQPTPPAS